MTKTICDICGKEMPLEIYVRRIEDYKFCISSYGKAWDICTECRNELNEWINKRKSGTEDKGKLSWLGKNCKDCGNEKCKSLGTLPKSYDCALWQPKVENYSIKTVTNAKDAENYPISEDISKGIEEINKLIFENGQAERKEDNGNDNH